ncbi:hypothetical protein NP233_g12342 [Leucocoprinus birnbaumii]|uniref:glutathione transferase n=1 Tax=Leucocoprinus birnbaumii TaxID=56174 RepID=A0AAD5YN54_9AGAR|nr:hypothetical protein NP233_g12342 [Leucocoprinus birnbaumii]
MVLTLWGSPLSTCTRRVATVLHEKKVPFKFVPIDLGKGEHKTPQFLSLQPFGQVPVLDDDGFKVHESRAICRYIVEKYPDQGTPGLIPKDLKDRALFEQAASIETSNFSAYAEPAVFENVFKKYRGGTPDEEKFNALIAQLDAKLDVYDQVLSKQNYLSGDQITLADLFHLPYGTMLAEAGSDIMSRKPNVSRWFKELENRPSWQAVKDGVEATA